MAGKRKPKLEDKAQSRRFVETAHKLLIDEDSSEAFKRAIGMVVPPLKPQHTKKKKPP